MPTKPHLHGGFSKGMLRDVASWEAPEGYCWNAENMLCDVAGKIRKRGGWFSPSLVDLTGAVENLMAYKSGAIDAISTLYGSLGKGGSSSLYNISRSDGSAVGGFGVAANDTFACKPFQHGNIVIAPFQALGNGAGDANSIFYAGGGTGASRSVTGATVVANDNRVTAMTFAAGGLVAAHKGCIIEIDDAGGGNSYLGRIVEVTSAVACRVDPVPRANLAATAGHVEQMWNPIVLGGAPVTTGRYGLSYQGRVVLAYTLTTRAGGAAVGLDTKPNRVIWTNLGSEPFQLFGSGTNDGQMILNPGTFPAFNYLDIPGLPEITGLVAAGEGDLIVFGKTQTYRISGQLSSLTALDPNPTFSDDRISASIGCPYSKSIQQTRSGVIFLGADNLYVYDGASMKPLLTDSNASYLQDRLLNETVLGSFYSAGRNHYYLSLSGAEGGLLFNLDGMQMTKQQNMQIMDSATDPDSPSRLWAARYWNTAGAAPTFTKGPLISLEEIWQPTALNQLDGDGTPVGMIFESKAYVDGDVVTLKRFTLLKVGYDLRCLSFAAIAVVYADTAMNTSDAAYVNLSTTLGSLPRTPTKPGQKGFRCLPLLPKGQALEVKITQLQCDSFELLTLETEVQELRRGRSS